MRPGKERASCSTTAEDVPAVPGDLCALQEAHRLDFEELERHHRAQLERATSDFSVQQEKQTMPPWFHSVMARPRAPCKSTGQYIITSAVKEAVRSVSVEDLGLLGEKKIDPEEQAIANGIVASTLSISESTTVEALYTALRSPAARLSARRLFADQCTKFVAEYHLSGPPTGSSIDAELPLASWAVVSFNEWGRDDERVLVLTTHAVYRLRESESGIALCRRTPLTEISAAQPKSRGGFAFVGCERDGESNAKGSSTVLCSRAGLSHDLSQLRL